MIRYTSPDSPVLNFTVAFPGTTQKYSSGEIRVQMKSYQHWVQMLNVKAYGWFYVEVAKNSIRVTNDFKVEVAKDQELNLWVRISPLRTIMSNAAPVLTLKVWTPGELCYTANPPMSFIEPVNIGAYQNPKFILDEATGIYSEGNKRVK